MDIEQAFKAVLEAEEVLSAATAERKKAEVIFGNAESAAETKLSEAWKVIEELMAETGEYEVILNRGALDLVIGWSTPRQSVKVVDVEALPEDLVKIEKKPKLKEIGERLKQGWLTNAAKFELGEKKLQWKSVKHKEQANGN